MSRLAPMLLTGALLPGLLLAACATDQRGGYPSLAPRAVERLGFAEPDPPAPKPVVADPALDAAIAQARASLDKGRAAFDVAAATATGAADRAKGRPAGSDAWIEAQTQLATLDSLRADTSLVVTDLEQRAIARAADLAPDYPALATVLADAQAQAAAQGQRINAIQSRLPAL